MHCSHLRPLQALATRRQPEKRAETKFRLIRGHYGCGLTRPQLLGLFRLLDWVLALPKPLEYTFKQDLARFEKEHSMPYITSIERIGREEGRKEEHEQCCQTLRKLILNRHLQRWGDLEAAAQGRLQKIGDLSRLGELLAELMTASTAEDWKNTF